MEKQINKTLLLSSYYSFFVNGMLVLTTGAIMPYLIKDFHMSYMQGGFLLLVQAIGNLFSGIASGFVSEYLGRKLTLIFGAAAFFIAFGGITLTYSRGFLSVLIFISGLGWGTVNNLVNAVLNDETRGKGSIINILHMSYGIGAFIAPAFAGIFIGAGLGWRFVTALVAFLSFTLVIALLPIHIESAGSYKNERGISFSFLREIHYYIFMGILFFYVGSEAGINGWMATYLIDSGITGETGAQGILSLLWMAVIAGRLLCAYLTSIVKKQKIIMICSICAVLFYFLFLIVKVPAAVLPCIFFLGVSLSGIYPTTVANASYLTKGSGISSGILFSFGGIGASVIPYMVGVFAQHGGIRAGMLVILIASIILALLAIVNAIYSNKPKK